MPLLPTLSTDHDACGIAGLATTTATHANLQSMLTALVRMTHRGGQTAEGGDGAGVLFAFDREWLEKLARDARVKLPAGEVALGTIFVPPSASRVWEKNVASACKKNGARLLGVRRVRVNPKAVPAAGRAKIPGIFQIFVAMPTAEQSIKHKAQSQFDESSIQVRQLALADALRGVLPPRHALISFSTETVIYKGMLTPAQLGDFFAHDLRTLAPATRLAIAHTRFSTNTNPDWAVAQPFSVLCHNGEINTFRAAAAALAEVEAGNIKRKKGLRTLVARGGSDSQNLDRAAQALLAAGYDYAIALTILMPPANFQIKNPRVAAALAHHKKTLGTLAAWEGPAGIASVWSGQLLARVDRMGLRPLRYLRTKNNSVFVCSEYGAFDIPASEIAVARQLLPGEAILATPTELFEPAEFLERFAARNSTIESSEVALGALPRVAASEKPNRDPALDSPEKLAAAYGWTEEKFTNLLKTARQKSVPLGAMGYPHPLPVLSRMPHLYRPYQFVKEAFAQVTNPPIDSVRESKFMDMSVYLGGEISEQWAVGSGQSSSNQAAIRLTYPILTNSEFAALTNLTNRRGDTSTPPTALLDTSFAAKETLTSALKKLTQEVIVAAKKGVRILLLSDRAGAQKNRLPIPGLLAADTAIATLTRLGCSSTVSVVVAAGDVAEPHDAAMLLAAGAKAVNPWLAFSVGEQLADKEKNVWVPAKDTTREIPTITGGSATVPQKDYGIMPMPLVEFEADLFTAFTKGLQKILAKMGVPNVDGYRGSGLATSIGLACLSERFPSPVGGWGVREVGENLRVQRKNASAGLPTMADEYDYTRSAGIHDFGRFLRERGGEFGELLRAQVVDRELNNFNSLLTPPLTVGLEKSSGDSQAATTRFAQLFAEYKTIFADRLNAREERVKGLPLSSGIAVTLSDLLVWKKLKPAKNPELDFTKIQKILSETVRAGHISHGAIWELPHEAIALGCNELGVVSGSGEGGISFYRTPGTENTSVQIASGRFGVTTEYIRGAKYLQIKVAQGAKPGEGGHLPGKKVGPEIAEQRFCAAGTDLISPPPHHDIYSIEDLAELIWDLRKVNPDAQIEVKLVAGTGVGVVACGVAKAGADAIILDGLAGGTGAAGRDSIEHAAIPTELGVVEVHRALSANGLRAGVKLFAGGGVRTGREAARLIALGADGVILGSILMAAVGCDFLRRCHTANCPARVASAWDYGRDLKERDEAKYNQFLRETADRVKLFLACFGAELATTLAELGVREPSKLVGTGAKVLRAEKRSSLDLTPLLAPAKLTKQIFFPTRAQRAEVAGSRESAALPRVEQFLGDSRGQLRIENIALENVDRAFGGGTAGLIAARVIEHRREIWRDTPEQATRRERLRNASREKFQPDQITLVTHGIAGQSFGFALPHGVRLELTGLANDYAGKALSGGTLVIRRDPNETVPAEQIARVGNVCFFGATSGRAYVNGRAGQRLGVRASGATIVCEGCGDLALEYLTGGVVAILGECGAEVGAGMSGGVGYFYDPRRVLVPKLSSDVIAEPLSTEDEIALRNLLKEHAEATGSVLGLRLFEDFALEKKHFAAVRPKKSGQVCRVNWSGAAAE